MNELNNREQEQYAEPTTKKSSKQIVKRTLVVIGLALAVYVVYSVVYLFISPDRNIQQIYLVPENAAFIIQSSAPIEDWEKFSGSETWQCLKKAKSFEEVTKSVEKLDSVVKSNKVLLSLVGKRDMLISLHKTRATDWDFLLILDMQKASKMDLVKDQLETVLVMSGFTVTNRMHSGINILEMRDPDTRDIFYIAFFIIGLALFIWVSSLIKPLKLIKNYIDDIKNDKESELHIQREDEIGVLSSSLIEMKEEIDRQNEIKEEMIHNISHDLKTPIALIQTYAQSIKDDIYPYGDKDSSVDVILENTDRLEKKVKSLLYLNRLDYISGQIGDETCSMKELIEHIVFQLTAMHTQIEILTDLQDSSFKGKDDYWRICIENIIENAARYVHHEIKIILKDQYLEIFNDGEPIDNSNPESLFQPYEIGHKGQFGLGLSIVYKTVTMYGYKVEAVNRVDGVSFIIQKKD